MASGWGSGWNAPSANAGGGGGGGVAVAAFNPLGINFNSTLISGTTNTAFTGVSAGHKFLLSFWFRRTKLNSAFNIIFENSNQTGLQVQIDNLDRVNIAMIDSASGILIGLNSNPIQDTFWHHVLCSIDNTSTAGGGGTLGWLTIDGVSNLFGYNQASNGLADFARASTITIGERSGGTLPFLGDLGEFYLYFGQYLDPTNATNIQKFRTTSGLPVDLGTDGSTPLGTAPTCYFSSRTNNTEFLTNRGTGGLTFTVTTGSAPTNGNVPPPVGNKGGNMVLTTAAANAIHFGYTGTGSMTKLNGGSFFPASTVFVNLYVGDVTQLSNGQIGGVPLSLMCSSEDGSLHLYSATVPNGTADTLTFDNASSYNSLIAACQYVVGGQPLFYNSGSWGFQRGVNPVYPLKSPTIPSNGLGLLVNYGFSANSGNGQFFTQGGNSALYNAKYSLYKQDTTNGGAVVLNHTNTAGIGWRPYGNNGWDYVGGLLAYTAKDANGVFNFVGSSALSSGNFDHATDTHGPFSVGAAQTDNKLIIVGCDYYLAFNAPDTVQCNGVTMDIVDTAFSSGQNGQNFYVLSVAGSTTSVTITVNEHSNGLKASAVGVWWASDANLAPVESVGYAPTLYTTPNTQNTVINSRGFLTGVYQDQTTETLTITGMTQDATNTYSSGGRIIWAHDNTIGKKTITLQGTGGGYDISGHTVAWSALDPHTTAWINAVIAAGGTVSTTQKMRVNRLIKDLKLCGAWEYLDAFYVFAGESVAQQAMTDIVGLRSLTKFGTVNLAAAGYTSDGTTGYFKTGFTPSVLATAHWQKDYAMLGGYISASRTTNNAGVLMGMYDGASYSYFTPLNSGQAQFEVNDAAQVTQTNTDAKARWTLVRNNSTTLSLIKNGTSLGSYTRNSNAVETNELYLLALNNNGTAASFSPDTVGGIWWGADHNSSTTLMDTAIATYFNSWGV